MRRNPRSWLIFMAAMAATAAIASIPLAAGRVVTPGGTATLAPSRADREVVIPADTVLRLRLDTSHASNSSRVEDRVEARLVSPVVVNGVTAIPANAEATGHVTAARPSGKVKGRAYLAVRFTELRADGERYRVTTRSWAREAPGTKKKDAATIAVPGAVGGVVGAVVGGKKGAAVGAGVGAGAGTGVVLSTAGQEVRLGRGATLLVRLSAPLTVRVDS